MDNMYLLQQIDDEVYNSQMAVIESMTDVYYKALTILEECKEEDISSFSIFNESYIMEADDSSNDEKPKEGIFRKFKKDKNGNKIEGEYESIAKSIALSLFRLIQFIFEKLTESTKETEENAEELRQNVEEVKKHGGLFSIFENIKNIIKDHKGAAVAIGGGIAATATAGGGFAFYKKKRKGKGKADKSKKSDTATDTKPNTDEKSNTDKSKKSDTSTDTKSNTDKKPSTDTSKKSDTDTSTNTKTNKDTATATNTNTPKKPKYTKADMKIEKYKYSTPDMYITNILSDDVKIFEITKDNRIILNYRIIDIKSMYQHGSELCELLPAYISSKGTRKAEDVLDAISYIMEYDLEEYSKYVKPSEKMERIMLAINKTVDSQKEFFEKSKPQIEAINKAIKEMDNSKDDKANQDFINVLKMAQKAFQRFTAFNKIVNDTVDALNTVLKIPTTSKYDYSRKPVATPPAQPLEKTPINPKEATPDEDAPEGLLYRKNDRAMESAIINFDFNSLSFNG